jgi:phosphoglycerate dehydrogenase-like enzyme
MIPAQQDLTIQFAHIAYRLAERFRLRETGIAHFQTWTPEETLARVAEADVLVLSGFWRPQMLDRAGRLRFIQVSAAGYDNFDLAALGRRGIRLANGQGVNSNAVSEHAMALILAFTRQIHLGRDNQRRKHWRGMVSEFAGREDELAGKTLLVFGAGTIGGRLARLAKAFDMRAIGVRRSPPAAGETWDEIHPPARFLELLPGADFLALACPLTVETAKLVDARALAAMRPEAYLINVARGGCVDQDALIEALEAGSIAGAGIDTVAEEPLSADSPLWTFDNVILTPHTGGETRKYEDNVVDVLLENLDRLWRGETELRNQVL